MSWCRCRRSWLSHDIVSDMKWWYITYSVLYISMHLFTLCFLPFDYWSFSLPSRTTRRTPQPFTEDEWSESPTDRADLDFKHSQRAVMLEAKSCQWTSLKSARGASLYSSCLQGSLQKRFWDHGGGIQEVCDIVAASTMERFQMFLSKGHTCGWATCHDSTRRLSIDMPYLLPDE